MDVDREITDLHELAGQFWADEGPIFSEPWQARAFGLALALSEGGVFSLRDFQTALIAKISSFEESQCIAGSSDYYTRWIEALEDLLWQRNMLPADRLSCFESDIADNAESRKAHQRMTSRDENGQLKIAPLIVDPGIA